MALPAPEKRDWVGQHGELGGVVHNSCGFCWAQAPPLVLCGPHRKRERGPGHLGAQELMGERNTRLTSVFRGRSGKLPQAAALERVPAGHTSLAAEGEAAICPQEQGERKLGGTHFCPV